MKTATLDIPRIRVSGTKPRLGTFGAKKMLLRKILVPVDFFKAVTRGDQLCVEGRHAVGR